MKSESIQANANNIYDFFCLDKEQKLVLKQWTWAAGCHGSCFYNLLQAVMGLRISRNSWNLFKYVRSDEIAVMKFVVQLPTIRSCEKKCWASGRWGEASSKKILSRAAAADASHWLFAVRPHEWRNGGHPHVVRLQRCKRFPSSFGSTCRAGHRRLRRNKRAKPSQASWLMNHPA
jgi:hypothetical protein